jgi:hypothetical protein
MNKLTTLASLVMVAALTGCATRPISNFDAANVPAERVIDSRYLQPIPSAGLVTIKRDSGFFGGACSTRIFVNAKPVADIRTSEKVVLYLAEEEYVFSAWPNVCGGGLSEVRAPPSARATRLAAKAGSRENPPKPGLQVIDPTMA